METATEIREPEIQEPTWDVRIGHIRARCVWSFESNKFVVQARTIAAWETVAEGDDALALLAKFVAAPACQRVLQRTLNVRG